MVLVQGVLDTMDIRQTDLWNEISEVVCIEQQREGNVVVLVFHVLLYFYVDKLKLIQIIIFS